MLSKSAILLFALVLSVPALCQDRIIMRTLDTLNVQIVEASDELVKFKYPKEELVTSLSKSKIQKILFQSGRVEVCNQLKELPKINGREDWEKVIVTFEAQDVAAFKECGKVTGRSGVGGVASVQGGQNAIKDMQKDAAEMGAGIILITEGWHKEKNKPISGYGRGVKLIGIAYK